MVEAQALEAKFSGLHFLRRIIIADLTLYSVYSASGSSITFEYIFYSLKPLLLYFLALLRSDASDFTPGSVSDDCKFCFKGCFQPNSDVYPATVPFAIGVSC